MFSTTSGQVLTTFIMAVEENWTMRPHHLTSPHQKDVSSEITLPSGHGTIRNSTEDMDHDTYLLGK